MAEDLEDDFEEADSYEDSEPAQVKRKIVADKKKLILFVVLPLLLIVGGAAGAYFSGVLDPLLRGGAEKVVKKAEPEKPAGDVPQAAVFYDLPEILVNLNSSGQRRQNFLKIRVSLELASPLDVSKIESVMPRIVDNFQVYLRELRIEDLQGSAGLLRLREELLTRVSAAVKPAKVNDVLFKEMLVQ